MVALPSWNSGRKLRPRNGTLAAARITRRAVVPRIAKGRGSAQARSRRVVAEVLEHLAEGRDRQVLAKRNEQRCLERVTATNTVHPHHHDANAEALQGHVDHAGKKVLLARQMHAAAAQDR